VQHAVVQKHQGIQGLGLGGGRHPSFNGQVVQKAFDLNGPQIARMPLAVKEDELPDPETVGLFSTPAVMAAPASGGNLVE
jgi:hypothetical protein